MLGRSLERSRGCVVGGSDVVAVLLLAAVGWCWIDSEAKADSRSSPPLDEAQNFMYRSTILV
jgi:hypothetical protein